jgi:HTH-type transcriptional regulator / antitoxin HipB
MSTRAKELPTTLRQSLVDARRKHGWSQAELGARVGLPQMHISAIETGRVVPRYDTLLDLVRVLDHDLILVPRDLVPVVQSLVREQRNRQARGVETEEEQPLYALDDEEDRSA